MMHVALGMVHLVIWEACAAALFWSCFCRARHTHKGNTKRDIRWAFTALGVMSVLSVIAPFYGYDPDGFTIALLATIALVQLVTAHHWRNGLPQAFRRQP